MFPSSSAPSCTGPWSHLPDVFKLVQLGPRCTGTPSPSPMFNIKCGLLASGQLEFNRYAFLYTKSTLSICLLHKYRGQECIPVGCVPASCRPYAGDCFPGGHVCLVGGICLVWGVSVWSRRVCLVPGGAWFGGSAWSQGGSWSRGVWHPSMH